ncbi:MAG TPA: tRNA pseudouridine(55) synthase TruB [Thermoguttaceae bacterium]|nr:tRNA pseudouridine(55) synthase TruB [Thermoguttaceae bacterium]
MRTLHGVLNLNKPAGITSRRVVDLVQRLARGAKCGHAGTLDPLASGVLVVCVGPATRLIEYVQRMPKSYLGTFLLGRQSPTEDVQGDVTELEDPPVPSADQIAAQAEALTGRIQQRPPAYSALKVEGKRAYALAREGRQVELKPRSVVVYRLEVVAYDYPELQLRIECGSGTYVRSLGRDLAESLSTGAVMSGLVRTAIGSFGIDDAVDPRQLTREGWTEHLLPPSRAVDLLPRIALTAEEIDRVRVGQAIPRQAPATESPEIAAVDSAGRLVAILVPRGPGLLGPARNLPLED